MEKVTFTSSDALANNGDIEAMQYQIYLKALDTLEQRGYAIHEIRVKKHRVQAVVKKTIRAVGKFLF